MSFLTERYYQMLDGHTVYGSVCDQKAFRLFCEQHVICVWSYQALIRSLRKDTYSLNNAILKPKEKEILRLLSELSLDEEAYESDDGRFLSHLELYLEAMADLSADLRPIRRFFHFLDQRLNPLEAARLANFSPMHRAYIADIHHVLNAAPHQKASALFCEGECYIPNRFLYRLQDLIPRYPVQKLLEYFEVHIEGLKQPGFSAAVRLMELYADNDERALEEIDQVGERLMHRRLKLWDQIQNAVGGDRPAQNSTRFKLKNGAELTLLPP